MADPIELAAEAGPTGLSAASDAALALLLRAALAEALRRVVAAVDLPAECGWNDLEAASYPADAALVAAIAALDPDAHEALLEVATHVFNGDLGGSDA